MPISRLAECVTETQRDAEDSGFIAPMVGHVGDGNFHMLLLVDNNDAEEIKRAEDCSNAWSSARSPWTAPAPASTASVRAR